MNRKWKEKEIILAVLSASKGAVYTPVQVQKLLFLVDKEIPQLIDGPYFKFIPYAYGPLDTHIYELLKMLERNKDVECISASYLGWIKYRLTVIGEHKGQAILNKMDLRASNYIKKLSLFVRSITFTELVSTICKVYPEMKKVHTSEAKQ